MTTRKKPLLGWRASIAKLTLADTSLFFYVFKFPRIDGGTARFVVPRDGLAQPGNISKQLLFHGAHFPNTKEAQRFVVGLIASAEDKGCTGDLVRRCGWHGKNFVLAKSHVSFQRDVETKRPIILQPPQAPTYLGRSSGDLASWQEEVALPARSSSLAMFGIGAALAAPLARHAGSPEGVIFNFAGPSSTGKTTAAKVAASVSGNPDAIPDFNITPTAAEEIAAGHSDHLLIMDDTERTQDNPGQLIKRLNHILVGGQSKKRSAAVRENHPQLDWSLTMLMTSPVPVRELVEEEGLKHSLGAQVRLIDLPVPDGPAGVFDLLEDGSSPAEQARLLELGFAVNHGVLIKAWTKKLPKLKVRVASEVERHIRRQEEKAKRAFEGAERRFLRKIMLPIVAANEARKANLLPWDADDVRKVYKHAVKPALKLFRSSQLEHQDAWAEMATRMDRRDGLFDLRAGGKLARKLRTHKGSHIDIGVIVSGEDGDTEVGMSIPWVKRFGTVRSNPIVLEVNAGTGAPIARFTDITAQKRLKVKSGKVDRTRLVYLPAETLETLVQANAGKGFEDWRLDP